MEVMMKCVKCSELVPEEAMDERYKELLDMGIQPNMVVMCKDCRLIKMAVHRLNYD